MKPIDVTQWPVVTEIKESGKYFVVWDDGTVRVHSLGIGERVHSEAKHYGPVTFGPSPEPSFIPGQILDTSGSITPGPVHLSKREYFAACALQGALSGSKVSETPERWAMGAVLIADALIAELAKVPQ